MAETARGPRLTEGFAFSLLFAAFAVIQVLIGGTRMVFSLPAYALVGMAGMLGIFSLRRLKPGPSHLCLAVSGVFFAYILGRAFLSPVPYIARSDIHSVLGGLAVYFLVACVLTGARQRVWFIILLLALAAGHVLVGVVQFRDGNNFMPISWLQRYDYEWRASGFYICPNHLAGLLEVVGVMGLSIVCWSRWPAWSKLLIGYVAGICYIGLILTGSRGGYLSTVASLFVFAALSVGILRRAPGNRAWTLGALGAVAALLVGLGAFFYGTKSHDLKDRAQTTFDTSNIRLALWPSAIEQWKLEPILGTGSATFRYYGRFFRSERMQRDPIYVHNDYLQLLAEYGALGVLGMAAFVAVHLRQGLRNFLRLGPKRVAASELLLSNALALNLGAIAAVSSYMVHSIFDFNLHIPANVLLLAFVFALLANDGVVRGREPAAVPRSQTLWRLALPVLGVILLVQCARLLPGEYYSERARMAVRDQEAGAGLLFALRGLQYDPFNPDLHYHLGRARLQFGDASADSEAAASFRRAGIADLERARVLAPKELNYALELAGALDLMGRYDEAERVFDEVRRLDPKSDSVRRYYEGHLKRREEGPPPGPEAPVVIRKAPTP